MIKNIERIPQLNKVTTEAFEAEWLLQKKIRLNVLRLDLLHPVISGNKWFKLKYYLADAKRKNCTEVITFGGAWSNHIVATAFACNKAGFESVGIIRGEKPHTLSHTLISAQCYGMKLLFTSRNIYRNKSEILKQFKNAYHIPEGGYGSLAMLGSAEILSLVPDCAKYTHIVCAVGTGTMMAGIIHAALHGQHVIGISVMKENRALEQEVIALLPLTDKAKTQKLLQKFHFGGYAKKTNELIQFMQNIWIENKLPTDFVYTAKTLYAIKELVETDYFIAGSNVLMIHSGGLQGNKSLPAGVLPF